MSTGGSSSNLSSCGCCQGMPALSAVTNRAGLSAIAYRIGTYGVFFEQMLDQIHSITVPDIQSPQPAAPLSILTTRSQDDPSIALLDVWAIVADILTFYQERIANEGFLRTATERRSVLELARAIGYELSPGVSASVYLQFTVEEIIGAPAPAISIPGVRTQSPAGPGSAAFNSGVVSIPQGTQVQSVPAPVGFPRRSRPPATLKRESNGTRSSPGYPALKTSPFSAASSFCSAPRRASRPGPPSSFQPPGFFCSTRSPL